MDDTGFTHLHVHSEYSLLDGAASIKKLVSTCKELGMDTVALTDHGNMFGAIAFYQAALKQGIKPILGIEAYIAPGSRSQREARGIKEASYHLILLAANKQGYQNLLKLASIGYLEGFYYRPRIDREVLEYYHEGLICTSACLSGEIPALLGSGQVTQAREAAEYYLKLFGEDRFFIEIQWHTPDQNSVTPMLVDLAHQVGAGIVATNDVHFLRADDYRAHEALTCISTGKLIDDEKRMRYPPDLFLKSPEQMRQTFSQWPQACDNTTFIARQCNVELDFNSRHAPVFTPPAGKNPNKFIEELCLEGIKKRYGRMTSQIKERLYRELEVIEGKNFSSYFLIVWDVVRYARENGIPTNPRGSGVGTLVGYALGISNVDPLRYGLLFERFMDPERNEMPDIDIDICQNGRAQVIDYVRGKYGHVAQIITFGTMKARAVIRDVCRVLNVPLVQADQLAKLVPETLGITLEDALEQVPKLKEWYKTDEKVHEVIEIGKRLEGLARHASVHAAGVVIADKPLDNFLPLYKAADSDEVITQYDGPTVEKVGLLKMDFLGLRTLTTIERARELVKLGRKVDIDLNDIDLTDEKVLQLFAQGRTKGIFQFESAGMRDLLQNMRPDRIEDLIAANALYRPGPMTLIPDYNSRKHGQKWTVPHPKMKKVLNETYGIMVYQEQVMQILNGLGNLPLARAYRLIKAIGKKKHDIIKAESDNFIEGCVANGITREKAMELFELIQRFAGYGFNKSHSTQYAILAFQTAYFKTYYPTEFMAALLTFEMSSKDKVADYIEECRQMGIKVLPPDINECFADFTVIYDNIPRGECIRFGLEAVKGVGSRAVAEIIRARNEVGRFTDIFQLCRHIDNSIVNRGALESLIKAGALDSLGGSRAQLTAVLDEAHAIGTKYQQDKKQGQLNFFETFESDDELRDEAVRLPDVNPWPQPLLLQYEKEVLGLYVTDHPLSAHAEQIHYYSTAHSNTLGDKGANAEVIIGGIITRVRFCVTKNGRGAGARMAMFTLEDLNGTVDGVIFPDSLALYEDLIQPDKMVFLRGLVDFRREEPSIRVNQVYDMTRAAEELTHAVYVQFENELNTATLEQFKNLCLGHPGRCPVYIQVVTSQDLRVVMQIQDSVRPDTEFCRRLAALVGKEHFKLLRPHDQLATVTQMQ
ncbi:MAG: DNA polymerase III subunit alpha [Sedimentisphaerales bacterium]|nr:DNA polymerase III subunit alpha [Sedimentisphaerales bacterium]